MESFLTKLATYKLMDISGLVDSFLNCSIQKLLISFLLLLSIIGTSLYILLRIHYRQLSAIQNGSAHVVLDPHILVNSWISQNKRFYLNAVDLCVAFLNCYNDKIKVPAGVNRLSYLPHLSSPILYSQKSPPVVSENVMSILVHIAAARLSFSGEMNENDKHSQINFSLSDFSLEVMLNMSFRNTNLVTLRAFSSRPQFSLSIDPIDLFELVKQDLVCTVDDIISNLSLIWENAEALLESQGSVDISKFSNEKDSDLNQHTESNDPHLSSVPVSGNSSLKETLKQTSKLPLVFDSNVVTESVHPLPESPRLNAIPINGLLHTANVSSNNGESDEKFEVLPEPVVLAHNPSLKKKLSGNLVRRRLHQRSASDFQEQQVDDASVDTDSCLKPVPLDPVVHPSRELQQEEQPEEKQLALQTSQRSLKKVTDISPLHERVAPNLASKNLLVKVVKADFIDLRNSSDAYCVVELDEPYQRHATHVVPSSEQLFWDQHLLFGLNSNSKRAAFEVFELSKKRKSISRGYAEIYLPELLTSSVGGCSTELLRCISLDSKQHSSTTGLVGSAGVGGGGKWEHGSSPATSFTSLAIRKPTVTAEFHFMERIVDDPFSVCKGRSVISSPVPLPKLSSTALTSPTSSSDSSLSQAAARGGGGGDQSSQGSKEKMEGNGELELEGNKDSTPTPLTESGMQHESRLQRSTSTRGSRLFEPAFENLRLADSNAALTSRQHQPSRLSGALSGFRRKSAPRSLSTGVGSSPWSSGYGLLGPSSALAGVVAGLTAASVESSDASVDPSTAAAVASAVAVAAATGRSTSASAPPDRRSAGPGGASDSLFESVGTSTAVLGQPEHEIATDTVVRYAAPAANVAESLGTYSVQLPPKRSEAASTKLMSLFKPRRKQNYASGKCFFS
uniref:C2 domain-containing protein n=1 Tax=Mesocestoides corti TaxID=53468 RepID=A0A5K3FMN9_MESCO